MWSVWCVTSTHSCAGTHRTDPHAYVCSVAQVFAGRVGRFGSQTSSFALPVLFSVLLRGLRGNMCRSRRRRLPRTPQVLRLVSLFQRYVLALKFASAPVPRGGTGEERWPRRQDTRWRFCLLGPALYSSVDSLCKGVIRSCCGMHRLF